MNFLFAPRFNRAEFYGLAIFITALWNGAPQLLTFAAFIAWGVFAAFMEKRLP